MCKIQEHCVSMSWLSLPEAEGMLVVWWLIARVRWLPCCFCMNRTRPDTQRRHKITFNEKKQKEVSTNALCCKKTNQHLFWFRLGLLFVLLMKNPDWLPGGSANQRAASCRWLNRLITTNWSQRRRLNLQHCSTRSTTSAQWMTGGVCLQSVVVVTSLYNIRLAGRISPKRLYSFHLE